MPAAIPALRPLRHRDFRLLWSGLAISLIGDGLWLVAIAWQVIELGGGPVQLSLIATTYSLGLVGLVLVGGVAADRLPRRTVMLVADVVRAAVVAVLGSLSLTGGLEIWQLAVGGLLIGAGEAFFVPAYTAIVPRLLPEDELLAANGLEGMLRPLAQQAAGPALGGIAVAALSPGAAMLADCATYLVSAACLIAIRVRAEPLCALAAGDRPSPLADLRAGWSYVRRTPWLWATLLFAVLAVLFIIGPIEVLAPFVVRDRAGGDAAAYGTLLAVYGVGSALGALAISSRRLPRRYLSVMLASWGLGTLPLVAFGVSDQLWVMCAAAFVVGATGAAANVIWGTLLQRRVPDAYLGRVSSLDWFVSLGLMPVSMALAGPAADAFGLTAVFVVAAVGPVLAAALAYRLGRLNRDELAHPLDQSATLAR